MKTATTALGVLALLVSVPAAADMHGDEAKIRQLTNEVWIEVSQKAYDPARANPDGILLATSAGGLWQRLTPTQFAAQLNDSPNTLHFTPSHVEVTFLGASGDAALVTYYLTGRIDLPGGNTIADYRTRVSEVLEKKADKWLLSAGHYSPLYGGSGVRFQ